MLSPRLLRAYRATEYAAGPVRLRIGRRCTAMDAALARIGGRTAVFVTAWNPLSRRMPDGWNQRMQRRLAEHVRRHPVLPASGSLRRWQEEHLLVAADPRPVLLLARRFRQNAAVVVARHQAPRLVVL